MDSEIAWEDCIPDLPLDSQELPPLNALSSAQPAPLPNIDLLDLLSFDNNAPDHPHTPPATATSPRSPPDHHTPDTALSPTSLSPESLSRCTSPDLTASPPHKPLAHAHRVSPPPSVLSSTSAPPSQSSVTTAPPSPPPHPVVLHDDNDAKPSAPSPQHHQSDNNAQSHADVVLELSTRLASATAEASALRKRVASLASENRSLRGALDHANARLVAVAQAASAAPAPQAQPVMLGLTRMTTDAAARFGAALTVSDVSRADMASPAATPPDRKKRKRVSGAATTMACVMFLWGALVGSPGWLSSSNTTRSDANLPAVWKQEPSPANVPAVPNQRRAAAAAAAARNGDATWLPNCMRVLEPLPASPHAPAVKEEATLDPHVAVAASGDDEDSTSVTDAPRPAKRVKTEHSAMFVDMRDRDAAATVRRTDDRDPRHPQYSYVLCRDAQAAMDSVRSCASRMRRGETCGAPHTISLILPAEVVDGGADADADAATAPGSGASPSATPVLAEVQCAVMSVARIPVEHAHATGAAGATATGGTGSVAKYGRVLATVPDTGTVIRE